MGSNPTLRILFLKMVRENSDDKDLWYGHLSSRWVDYAREFEKRLENKSRGRLERYAKRFDLNCTLCVLISLFRGKYQARQASLIKMSFAAEKRYYVDKYMPHLQREDPELYTAILKV